MNKTALDQTAKKYWSEYFKEYGQMWVRDIPRRIKLATVRQLHASKIDGEFVPIAANVGENSILSIEASFVGDIDDTEAKILVTASFEPEGKLIEFICNRIS